MPDGKPRPSRYYDAIMSEHGDDVPHDPTPLPSDERGGTTARIRAAIGSAEALAVAAILTAALPLTSSLGAQLFTWFTWRGGGATMRSTLLLQAAGQGVFGIITIVLGCVAIARTDVFSPRWVRGASGGAIIFGLIEVGAAVVGAAPPLIA